MQKTSLGLALGSFILAAIASSCSSKDTSLPPHSDAGTGEGGRVEDARSDSPTVSDAHPACAPADVKGFSPSWKPPAPFQQGKCSETQIHDLISCYFDGADKPANCDKISKDSANNDCQQCLFTSSVVAQLGPVIIENELVGRLNVPGCIANFEGNVSASSCAAKYKAATDCAFFACTENCPGDNAAAIKARTSCAQDALTTVCKTYAAAAACSDTLLAQGGKAAPCGTGGTFVETAIVLGTLFCGAPPADAGSGGG